YDGLPRVEIHNEINLAALPFASARFGSDSYFFCFPFALGPATLTVRPEEQYGFAALPNDYLPGARRDAMTSQHVVALSDARATMLLAHRQAFHFVFPGYVRTVRSASKPAFPAMFTGKWPLPEATLYSKAFRRSNQGDMRLLGITTFPTVEPGLGNSRVFDYAVSSTPAPFDAVAAARFGRDFDIPPRAVYVPFAPPPSRSFFAVDQPNIRIVTVKQAETNPSSAITPTNLEESVATGEFVMRLQEIAGRNTPRAAIALPGRVTSAEIVNLTEEKVIAKLPAATPLVVSLGPYQTLTVRFQLATRE
ncbi:MAG: glycosyl hydrolase-related protein, partial [Bryobacteraceae bacterium]